MIFIYKLPILYCTLNRAIIKNLNKFSSDFFGVKAALLSFKPH
jgi:hypothetical protein